MLNHSLKRIFKYSVNYCKYITYNFVLRNYCIIFKKKMCHTFLEFHFTKHLVTTSKSLFFTTVFAFRPQANYSEVKACKKCRLHRRLNCTQQFAYA